MRFQEQFNKFSERVQGLGYQWDINRLELSGLQVYHAIGKVTVRNEHILVAMTKAVGHPFADLEQGMKTAESLHPPNVVLANEGLRTTWHVTTARALQSHALTTQTSPAEAVIANDHIVKVPAGESPWLPDGALIVASQAHEFFPSILVPGNDSDVSGRYQIAFPPGAPVDI